MKLLSSMNLLCGKRDTITIGEFRKSPGDVFLKVMMGMSFIITKNGKKIAILTAINANMNGRVVDGVTRKDA